MPVFRSNATKSEVLERFSIPATRKAVSKDKVECAARTLRDAGSEAAG
jgi:hypothetical protein